MCVKCIGKKKAQKGVGDPKTNNILYPRCKFNIHTNKNKTIKQQNKQMNKKLQHNCTIAGVVLQTF